MMGYRPTARQAQVVGVLREAGLPLEMSDFDDRLKKQKLFCIMKSFSPAIDYPFNWYVYGPYSPKLAVDLFEVAEHKAELANLDAQVEPPLVEATRRVVEKLGGRLADTQYLTLTASVLFFRRTGVSPSETVSRIRTAKPSFTEAAIRACMKEWEVE